MATELKIGIPTLHSISNPVLTKVEDVVAYLIQFLFANPGNTSSSNEGEMMSFRKLVSLYGTKDTNGLADKIGEMLSSSIRHYFPNNGYSATCTIEEEVGTGDDGAHLGNYGIVIAVRDGNGIGVCGTSKFKVARDGSSFSAVY